MHPTLQMSKDKSGTKRDRQSKFVNAAFKEKDGGGLQLALQDKKFTRLLSTYERDYVSDQQVGKPMGAYLERVNHIIMYVVTVWLDVQTTTTLCCCCSCKTKRH